MMDFLHRKNKWFLLNHQQFQIFYQNHLKTIDPLKDPYEWKIDFLKQVEGTKDHVGNVKDSSITNRCHMRV